MGLVKRVIMGAVENSFRVMNLVSGRFLETKGRLVYDKIKEDVAMSCPADHYAVVIDTKTEKWKTAENLVYAQRKINEMENPLSCYVQPLEDICLFFEKYSPE